MKKFSSISKNPKPNSLPNPKIKEPQKFVTTSLTRCKDTAFFDTYNKKKNIFFDFF